MGGWVDFRSPLSRKMALGIKIARVFELKILATPLVHATMNHVQRSCKSFIELFKSLPSISA